MGATQTASCGIMEIYFALLMYACATSSVGGGSTTGRDVCTYVSYMGKKFNIEEVPRMSHEQYLQQDIPCHLHRPSTVRLQIHEER